MRDAGKTYISLKIDMGRFRLDKPPYILSGINGMPACLISFVYLLIIANIRKNICSNRQETSFY
jgi:hypothetical protein